MTQGPEAETRREGETFASEWGCHLTKPSWIPCYRHARHRGGYDTLIAPSCLMLHGSMAHLRTLFSDLIKLFIGPHEEDAPDHPWWRIILVLAGITALFLLFKAVDL